MPKLTIGRVAAAAGVNVETIRYYHRRGLLKEPAKPLRGYRDYSFEVVKRVRFIKSAQALGFTRKEVVELLQLDDAQQWYHPFPGCRPIRVTWSGCFLRRSAICLTAR